LLGFQKKLQKWRKEKKGEELQAMSPLVVNPNLALDTYPAFLDKPKTVPKSLPKEPLSSKAQTNSNPCSIASLTSFDVLATLQVYWSSFFYLYLLFDRSRAMIPPWTTTPIHFQVADVKKKNSFCTFCLLHSFEDYAC
jgi:hypothetical protein